MNPCKSAFLAILSLAATLLVQGCSSTPPVAQDTAAENWGFSGKVGLRSAETHDSARINWKHCGQHYLIRLSGPLGVGTVRIEGGPDQVSLFRSDQPSMTADSPETLLADIGWNLPVSSLRFWLREQPVPDRPFQALPLQGPLEQLDQLGWRIHYQRNGDNGLRRVQMEQSGMTLTWIIQQWTPGCTQS